LNFQADTFERLNTARVGLRQVFDYEHSGLFSTRRYRVSYWRYRASSGGLLKSQVALGHSQYRER
jgi:hypothetical protein